MTDFSSQNGVLITHEALRPGSTADLVVYLGVTAMGPAEIVVQLKLFLERHAGTVESICVIAPKFREATVKSVLACDDFIQLKADLGVDSHPCLFGRDGKILEIDDRDPDRRSRMLRRILTAVVRARHGVLGASSSVHYAKPSQKHTDQFIRAGNVLVNSVEVEMIAWGCLSYISDEISFVYTDTGAINVVATALLDLLAGFGKIATVSVDSFGSYKGLESFEGTREGSLWLISATTSGNLAKQIIAKQRVEPRQIVSLFALGTPNDTAVCHLDRDDRHNTRGFPSIQSYDPSDCALCRAGSTPLWLTDEQFLVSDIAVTPYLPKRDDLSKDTVAALHQLVGENVFRVLFQPNHHTERSDIFLDIEPHASGLLADAPVALTSLAAKFGRRVRQSLPAAVDAIVHLDDLASTALASAVVTYLSARRVAPTVVRASQWTSHQFAKPPESIVVVASAIGSGTSVIDLSRSIRPSESVTSVSYLVLLDRSATEDRARQTYQSVTTTEDGHRYDYHVITRLPLPDPSAIRTNAWNDESFLLHKLLDSCSDDALRTALETRRDLLDKAKDQTQRGLRDELFWSAENGSALTLSPGFVFLPKDNDPTKISQADVYSVIRCLLHSLRTRSREGKEPPLKQHPLHRKVLDVGVFYRFNDPVLQAAFLRAADPAELDYANSDIGNQSANARLLLMRVFKDHKAPATEFALALALGRMRLTENDKTLALDEIAGLSTPLNGVTTAFLDEWKATT
ncbi:MAG: hypothetical protein KF901_01675 [Myxococcales bacterium]|nr:hypothetical protein [Myxococcales bacterium]